MHTNEVFLTKLAAAQIDELKALAATFDSNGAHTKALLEQLTRLGV
jgi:hypothetical protein